MGSAEGKGVRATVGEPAFITRAEAAELLGYSVRTLEAYMCRRPEAWPAPVGKRGQAYVYDRAAMIAAAEPAQATREGRFGGASSNVDRDGLVVCLYCGRRARNLEPHLRHTHGVTPAEYRAEHQLPATASMWADGPREQAHDRQREVFEDDPGAFDHLRPYHSREWTTAIAREAAETIRETSEYESVRARQAPGRRAGVQAMNTARRRQLISKARSNGFASIEEAIEATRHLPIREAAARTGLSPTTIRRWRQR